MTKNSRDSRFPFLKFFTSDHRADPGLRMCSFAARGLWVDMLTLMHEAEPYGHLLVNGKPPSAKELARLLGGLKREIQTLLNELETNEVFSRREDGVIYSRRMVRDRIRALEGRDNASKRWREINFSEVSSRTVGAPNGDPIGLGNAKPARRHLPVPMASRPPDTRTQDPDPRSGGDALPSKSSASPPRSEGVSYLSSESVATTKKPCLEEGSEANSPHGPRHIGTLTSSLTRNLKNPWEPN